jgi:hypothetical protein
LPSLANSIPRHFLLLLGCASFSTHPDILQFLEHPKESPALGLCTWHFLYADAFLDHCILSHHFVRYLFKCHLHRAFHSSQLPSSIHCFLSSWHLYSLFYLLLNCSSSLSFPIELELPEGREFFLFCSLLYPHHLKQTMGKTSICARTTWMDVLLKPLSLQA